MVRECQKGLGVQEVVGHMDIMGIRFRRLRMKVGRGDEELKQTSKMKMIHLSHDF
jgi:hypothetical protein